MFQAPFIKDFFFDLVKWLFSATIAAIPIMLISAHHFLDTGEFSYMEIVAHGELFILSIVMVAEPLGNLVMSPIKNTVSLIYTLMIVLILVVSGFYYSTIINNKIRVNICLTESHAIDTSKCQICSVPSILVATADTTNLGGIESIRDSLHNKHKHVPVKITDHFLEELSYSSKWIVGLSFILGIVSVLHLKLLEHRTGIKQRGI